MVDTERLLRYMSLATAFMIDWREVSLCQGRSVIRELQDMRSQVGELVALVKLDRILEVHC